MTAPSVLIRVLVERLLKVMATVLPDRAPSNVLGTEPDFMACLCWYALRTRVVSSVELRFSIDRRCRGANGDVAGEVVKAEYNLCCGFWSSRRHRKAGLVAGILKGCARDLWGLRAGRFRCR